MKKINVFFLMCFSMWSFAQVQWMTLEEALNSNATTPKKILINFYRSDCEACDRMNTMTYDHPDIAKLINEHFYAVKFNVEEKNKFRAFGREFQNKEMSLNSKGYHEFSKYLNVVSAPTIVFLDEKLSLITKLQGFFSPKELDPFLSGIANNKHQKITTKEQWLLYQKKFKSKIKE